MVTELRKWRDDNHVTLLQLAARLKVSIGTVSGWESGTKGMRVGNLLKLHMVTGIPVDVLASQTRAKDKEEEDGTTNASSPATNE